ncbi:MAG: type II secretion system protein M [Proteobacteria bacterium]|nr:type II secretion system protein M [Pseudomonadota bacterium]
MSEPAASSASPALASLRAQAATWWQARAPRERQLVAVAGIVIVVFICWSLLVRPALKVAQTAPAQIDALDAQLDQMKRVAAQSTGLRATPPVSPTQAGQALKAATEHLGDKAKLLLQGDRATLTLSGVSGDALRGWLNEARSAARARPIDAQLQRGPDGYAGTLVVTIGAAP